MASVFLYTNCTTTNSTLNIAGGRLKELHSFNHELREQNSGFTKLGVILQICRERRSHDNHRL